MARKIIFKAGDTAILDPKVEANVSKLQQIIERTGCDVSLLKKGLSVISCKDENIECQHPKGPRIFTIPARFFIKKENPAVAKEDEQEKIAA